MNKTLLVFRNELSTTLKRRSFILTLLLLPLIGFIVVLIIGNSQTGGTDSIVNQIFVTETKLNTMGIVDQSKLIQSIPTEYKDNLNLNDSQSTALSELYAGKISGFYLISNDYVKSGKVILFTRDFSPLSENNYNLQLESILTTSLLTNQPQLVDRVLSPMKLKMTILSPEPQRNPESSLTFFLPYIVTMIFYVVIMGSASLMLSSITNEKTNRMMEILMTSIKPMQILTGKILALGLVGLLQTLVWSGSGYLLLRFSGKTMNVSQAFQLPLSTLAWGIIFFLCGYALYASLMAGVGAMVPNLKEASQATTMIIIPLVIPLALIGAIVENPNGTLAMIFSLFPLTAPVTMMTRLAAGTVPLWQPLLSIILMLASSYYVVRSVAGLFHAQNLLSGQEFKIKYFFKALLGQY